MAAVVDLAGVGVVRGGSALLDDVNWTVDESDRWVVLGPNGAGKTTLLQLLAAQIHPTTGVVGLLVELWADEPPRLPEASQASVTLCGVVIPRIYGRRGAPIGEVVLGRLGEYDDAAVTRG